MTDFELHPSARPEVEAPNSVPTGSRFASSTETYSDGAPDISEPTWLQDEAKRLRIRNEINLGVALEAEELDSSTDGHSEGYVVYEKTARGWQATFHDE